MAFERFIDRTNNKQMIKDCSDFSLRQHGPSSSKIIYAFIAILLVNIILINDLCVKIIMLDPAEPVPVKQIITSLFLISFLITCATVFAYYMVNKIREKLAQTEFQNLLFSSSMSVRTKFLLIVDHNQDVMHFDYNFDKIFLSAEDHEAAGVITDCKFETLLAAKSWDDVERKKLVAAVKDDKNDIVKFELPSGGDVIIKIAPLSRPKGFSVIQAYDA